MSILNITTINGNFGIIEIPENIKYNFGIAEKDNVLFGDTNDSENWEYFSIQLKNKAKIVGFINYMEDKEFYSIIGDNTIYQKENNRNLLLIRYENTIEQKAEQILYKYIQEHEISANDMYDTVKAMIDFAKEMCELQKQECSNNAKIDKRCYLTSENDIELFDIKVENIHKTWDEGDGYYEFETNKESILNCKNVCNE